MERVYFRNYYAQIFERMEQLVSEGIFKDKRIFLFGLNSSSYVLEEYLNSRQVEISGYIDNSEVKRRNCGRKSKAYSPEQVKQLYGDRVVVLILSKYYSEMKEQLERLGYVENINIFRVLAMDALEQYIDFSDVSCMREISVDELKRIQMKLLRFLKGICEQHGLRYYLCGGSLIGAIRHHGYIPWDDDIDVAMPLEDCRKFIRIVNDATPYLMLNLYDHPDRLHCFFARLTDPETCIKTWNYPDMESLGINIDIFPIIGLPAGEAAWEFSDEMERIHLAFTEEFIKQPKPTEKYYELEKQILGMMEQYPFDGSENIAVYLLSRFKKKEIMPYSIFADHMMADFEGEQFAIPVGYDEYLTRLYGADYMEIPPESKRVSVHQYKAFVKK